MHSLKNNIKLSIEELQSCKKDYSHLGFASGAVTFHIRLMVMDLWSEPDNT